MRNIYNINNNADDKSAQENVDLENILNNKLGSFDENFQNETAAVDGHPERGTWGNEIEFILSCLGYAVGLGNIWRFPYLCYKNGGGAFFIPYIIMLFLVGMPLFLLEVTLGQFTSQGAVTCWEFAPFFTGLGYAMVLVSAMTAIYYNIIMAWSLRYLLSSFTSDLPWSKCREYKHQTEICSDNLDKITLESCNSNINLKSFPNGTCYEVKNNTYKLYGIYDSDLAKENDIHLMTAAESYFNYEGIQVGLSSGFGDLGIVRWDLAYCLLIAWIIAFSCMFKGIKSSGKVVYFTALFPYIVLIILLITGLTKEGSYAGIQYMFTPNMTVLATGAVWKDATAQIMFSLSTAYGGLMTLSSYNKFKGDVVRNTVVICLGNSFTSLMAGLSIFAFLGHLAHTLGVQMKEVVKSGVGLTFIAYPHVISLLPGASVISILFFFMLILLGLGSLFTQVQTVTTSILDIFPKLRPKISWVLLVICTVGYSVGISMCTSGGLYVFMLIDEFVGGWNLFFIEAIECIAISYVYGVNRFCQDIGVMVDDKVMWCIPWKYYSWYWKICWAFVSPALCFFVLLYSLIYFEPPKYANYIFPKGIVIFGHCMTASFAFLIVFPMFLQFILAKGSFKERMRALLTPTEKWGPHRSEHKKLIVYAD